MDVGQAKAKVGEWIDALNGKEISRSIAKYSSVYGDVLLGMHREIQAQNSRIKDYSAEMEQLMAKAHAEALANEARLQRYRRATIVSVVSSMIAVAVALWVLWTRA
jgi:hypothetical protein